jgi:hypothetical protein
MRGDGVATDIHNSASRRRELERKNEDEQRQLDCCIPTSPPGCVTWSISLFHHSGGTRRVISETLIFVVPCVL